MPGVFLVAGPPASVKAAGPVVSKALNGKGGGRAGRIQGKATQLQNAPAALQIMTQILQGNASAKDVTFDLLHRF